MAARESRETVAANQRLIRESMKVPLLSREREVELATRWVEHRDEIAMRELIRAHMRLAISIALTGQRSGLPLSDLIQQGHLGLLQAVEKFDPTLGVRFSTYATWWIRSAVQDFVMRNTSIVRIGTNSAQKAMFYRLRRLTALHAASSEPGDMSAAVDLIVEETGVSRAEVERLLVQVTSSNLSLDAPRGEDGEFVLSDLIVDERPTPEMAVGDSVDRGVGSAWIADALGTLPARERYIVRRRHLDDEPATLANLGSDLGVSKERVRQLEKRALDRIKEQLRKRLSDYGITDIHDAFGHLHA
ncbi:sigma-70 family RNA polymerase sigma factor [Oceanibacterium hippocampi]|uniref:RNA polymerase sigma factor n=1 Tax=Oceanibacterium hippocampi TaxID=745714 RepID=A0A1Y5RXV1_9PROT|nr:sigma-70 family RNA polymerase sigma factor [Oceanibacterium hippocampi]SLN28141.1 RNA polymerase sigma factor RpoH [Oceanibacterium hippocampi]